MLCVYKAAFWIVASVVSLWRGWYAVTILVEEREGKKVGELLTFCSERALPPDKWHHWSWWAHQIFINTLGSLIGWAAIYYLFAYHGKVDTAAAIFLVLLGMAGIFGFIPWLLFKSSLK